MKNSTIDPNVVIERLYVPNVGAKPIPGGKGIIIVGLLAKDGFPAMLLIWDEGDENRGASATNCMAALLLWVYKNWPDFPVKTSIMIQRDSTGWFNRIEAEWRNSMSISRQAEHIVNFKPIRWPCGATVRLCHCCTQRAGSL